MAIYLDKKRGYIKVASFVISKFLGENLNFREILQNLKYQYSPPATHTSQ